MYVPDVTNGYVCSSCDTDYSLETVLVNSQNHSLCLTTQTQTVPNCASYTYDGVNSLYFCSSCQSGFTLKNVSFNPRCLPNNVIDSQCTEYIYDAGSYKCNQCSSLYTLSSVYKSDGTFKNCLLASSQVIRDCSLYEILSGGGYQCKQCVTSADIDRYSFILNGIQAYRCLNTVSEHVELCTTYKYQSQLYECTQCESNYLKSNVNTSNVERIRCLSATTQIFEDCLHYVFDQSAGGYNCDQCNNDFTLKPKNVCVHNANLQDDCIEYKDNGLNEECTKCSS